ncbi:MAG: hypothetical protein KGH89_07815 [Thaumarchaeota archaeon]|nr:hypothetical protein [Nitrososphaerota archaeon]
MENNKPRTFYENRRPYWTYRVYCRLCQRPLKDSEIMDDMIRHGVVTMYRPSPYQHLLRKEPDKTK